ncbi:MAG: copper chaperone PCu(A)C [Gammaproteobacteria bacterium]|nr:copper chaperone PCu(A)C [Gammaproteobacteria bacterium]
MLKLGLCLVSLAAQPVWGAQADAVRVDEAWVRAAPPGAGMTAAFLALKNGANQEAVLVGAASAEAGSVELHGHSHEGGVMRMRAVARLPVPAHGEVRLAPGGLHLMVFEPKSPLKPGAEFPLELRFADGSRRRVAARVRSALD